jgi:uncharacterized protein (TIGR04255 family)
MGDYFPKIQDRLRLKGYPVVKNAVIQEVLLTSAGGASAKHVRWQVQDKSGTQSIVVTENFVAFQTTAYSVFEGFVPQLALAVDTLAEEVQGLYLQRIGLRYVDLVRPASGETWREYVRPELHGLRSAAFVEDSQAQLHQSTAQTPHGTMIVRLYQNREGQALPPDLTEDGLKVRVEPALAPNELVTLLDLDHFSVRQVDYERGFVESQAWDLHDDLDRVFRESVVTNHALKVWE